MLVRIIQIALLFAALPVVVTCGIPQAAPGEGGEPMDVPLSPSPPMPEYLTEEILPCTTVEGSLVDPCEPDAPTIEMGVAQHVPELGDEPRGLREMLDDDPPPPAWVTHLVLRGTYLLGTVRCTTGDLFRSPSYLRDELNYDINPSSIKCYIDMRANAYVLGTGPSNLTAMIFRYIYWDHEYTSYLEEGQTEEDYIEELRQQVETGIDDFFPGRENIVFLGPDFDLSSEAWRILRIWDVERREDDTVIAVHPYRDLWRDLRPDDYQTNLSKLEMELPAFTQAVTTAHQARVTEYGGRIGEDTSLPMLVSDANQLSSYFREVGAYDDSDGPPVQPPPPCGLAVPDQADNPGLMRDCINLLGLKDGLRGNAALNWSTSTAIASWDGVTTAGTPSRVTKLLLSGKSLTGTIPSELGNLLGLTHLNLSSNSLTGDIPRELDRLHNLEEIRLSGNSLTGCIPLGLEDVATSDLSSLNLPYCRPPVFGAASYSFSIIEDAPVGAAVGAVSAVDPDEGDTVTYSITAGNEDGKFAVDGSTGRITVVEALDYQTVSSYTLTVQASDGYGNSAEVEVAVSLALASCSNGTAAPNPSENPMLVADCSILLSSRDALEGTVVLNWSADVAMSRWQGVTVGGAPKRVQGLRLRGQGLNGFVPTELGGLDALTQMDLSENGLTGTVPAELGSLANLTILDLSDNGLTGGVPASLGNLLKLGVLDLEYNQLNGDIPASLGNLTGLHRLSLSANRLTGTIPPALGKLTRLISLDLAENRLSGRIPVELSKLASIQYLSLGSNRLTGSAPSQLSSLSNLQYLYLDNNALTGSIPVELGMLSELRILYLSRNKLTGSIPPVLGSLSKLEELSLKSNSLTGGIPAELERLSRLTDLFLSDNRFTGCIPAGLRDTARHDLGRLGLPYCASSP